LGAAATAAAAAAPPAKVRTAFIGVGNRAQALLKQTLAEPTAEITAICDIDAGARDAALSQTAATNPRSFTDWREVIELDDVDAVKIATPCHLHAEMASAALRAGKYVYCEKPLGVTPEQVAQVLEASRGAKGFLQIGQQIRYYPVVREAMRAIHGDGIAGDILVVRAQRNGTPRKPENARPRPDWYDDTSKSGDLIVENSVHNLDVCNWIIGDHPRSAFGHGGHYLPEFTPPGRRMMDGFSVQYVYDEDTHLDYTQLYFHARGIKEIPNGQYYMIYGTKGSIFLTHGSATFYEMQGDQEPVDLISPGTTDKKENAMEEFYAAIRDGRRPFADIHVGATAALTAILGREAIYRGESVEWNELGVNL